MRLEVPKELGGWGWRDYDIDPGILRMKESMDGRTIAPEGRAVFWGPFNQPGKRVSLENQKTERTKR